MQRRALTPRIENSPTKFRRGAIIGFGQFFMPLKTFDEYVALAEQAHGHICAGQILGLRLALYGLKLLDLDDPTGKHRKRLVTFVEIDRCATDAIPVVTGCRLGKRALK